MTWQIPAKPQILHREYAKGIQAWRPTPKPEAPVEPLKREGRYVGNVKFYDTESGHGYITLSNGGKDVLVRESDLIEMGLKNLNAGQMVSFDVQKAGRNKGRSQRAVNIRIE